MICLVVWLWLLCQFFFSSIFIEMLFSFDCIEHSLGIFFSLLLLRYCFCFVFSFFVVVVVAWSAFFIYLLAASCWLALNLIMNMQWQMNWLRDRRSSDVWLIHFFIYIYVSTLYSLLSTTCEQFQSMRIAFHSRKCVHSMSLDDTNERMDLSMMRNKKNNEANVLCGAWKIKFIPIDKETNGQNSLLDRRTTYLRRN